MVYFGFQVRSVGRKEVVWLELRTEIARREAGFKDRVLVM
jgi:hypothetical protein